MEKVFIVLIGFLYILVILAIEVIIVSGVIYLIWNYLCVEIVEGLNSLSFHKSILSAFVIMLSKTLFLNFKIK